MSNMNSKTKNIPFSFYIKVKIYLINHVISVYNYTLRTHVVWEKIKGDEK